MLMSKSIFCTATVLRIRHWCGTHNFAVLVNVFSPTEFRYKKRLYSSFQTISSQLCTKATDEQETYPDRLAQEESLAQVLADWYIITAKEVHSMINNCPDLLRIPVSTASKNAVYLKKYGLSRKTLLSYPWLLTFTEESVLSFRWSFAEKIHSNINVSAPFLELHLHKLQNLSCDVTREACIIPGGNRINYLSSRLECKPEEMGQIAAKHTFVLALPFARVERVLELLTDAEVSPQAILKDVWVFRYNLLVIEERLRQAKEAGLQGIRPWVVRCPKSTFDRTIQIHMSNRKLLGTHPSVVSYLCERLECDPEMIHYLSQKSPHMLRVNVLKLKEILDFVYEEGFTPQQVCQVPRVFNNSLETLQSRLTQLRNLGYHPNSLIVLCKSKKEFEDFLKKYASRSGRNYAHLRSLQ